MGCHTWFFKKVEPQPTYEEVRERYLHHLKIEMGYHERFLSGTLSEEEEFLFENFTKEISLHHLSVLSRKYRIVEGRYCKLATMRHYRNTELNAPEFSDKDLQFYEDVEGTHDIFRIGGYPEDELFSMEETLEFLNNHDDEIFSRQYSCAKEEIIEKLQEFWNKYPNGRITFG